MVDKDEVEAHCKLLNGRSRTTNMGISDGDWHRISATMLKALVEENEHKDFAAAIDTRLTAQAQGGVVEPVAVIGKDWRLLWASPDTLTAIVERTGVKIGSFLYAHPTPTELPVDALREAFMAGYRACEEVSPWGDVESALSYYNPEI